MNSSKNEVKLDTQEFQKYLRDVYADRKIIKEQFKNHQVLTITYHSLANEQIKTMGEILQFLDVPVKKLFTILKKQGSNSAIDPENYNELSNVYNEFLSNQKL